MANTDTEESAAAGPKGLKKLFGNKKMLLITAVAIALLLGGVVYGVYVFVLGGGESKQEQKHEEASAAPQAVYLDLPDFLVNIQGADGAPAYLKLSVSLELPSEEEKTGFATVQPRVIDQLQAYLRELRTDDLKGSAGVLRLKEEMLRRITMAAAPYHVRDVLFKEMVVQ